MNSLNDEEDAKRQKENVNGAASCLSRKWRVRPLGIMVKKPPFMLGVCA